MGIAVNETSMLTMKNIYIKCWRGWIQVYEKCNSIHSGLCNLNLAQISRKVGRASGENDF